MSELNEKHPSPGTSVRWANDSDVEITQSTGNSPAKVNLAHGAVWATAEPQSGGLDVSHGSLDLLISQGTILLDAQAGAGLAIVIRGAVKISSGGVWVTSGSAGDAMTFDETGRVSDPDEVDAGELSRDPFVSVNLVLDALREVPTEHFDPSAARRDFLTMSPDDSDDYPRGRRGLFARGAR